MKKKFTFLMTAIVLLLNLFMLPMKSWAEDSPDYTYTLANGDFSSTSHSHTSGDYTWTHSHGAGTESYGWDATYGFKFGSGKDSYPTSFTLTSSSISSKIKKIVVTANVNSKKSCKLDVKVGSTTYGSQVTINTKNHDTWEFSIADASTVNGAVELSFSSNTGPLYLEKIEIYYYSGSTPTTYTVSYDANGATSGEVPASATYAPGATVTVSYNTGSLAKLGHSFNNWNTDGEGEGSSYVPGATFEMPSNDVTLYAKWTIKTISSLLKSGEPTKTTYHDGDNFDSTGLTVTATYSDESSEDVTSAVVWSPDPLTIGTTYVTGTYMGKTVVVSGLTVTAAPTYAWVEANITDLTSADVFVIVGDNGNTYALPNNAQTSGKPSVVSVSVSNGQLSADPADNLKWNITGNVVDGYIFYPNGVTTNWLYFTNNNTGVCVGTGGAKYFTISNDGYLNTEVATNTRRYMGIYNSQDWRSYTSTGGNIENQTFKFYKKVITNNTFNITGDWNDITKWSLCEVPTTAYAVTISANCNIPDNCVATVHNVTIATGGSLTIADGGQLILRKDHPAVSFTAQKTVAAPATWNADTKTGWYAISSTVGDITDTDLGDVTNLTPATVGNVTQYDLYKYVEGQGWINQHAHNSDFGGLQNGHGYLYARKEGATLSFSGNVTTSDVVLSDLTADGTGSLKGIHFIGNPFTHNIYKSVAVSADAGSGHAVSTGFYKLNESSQWVAVADNTEAIKPGQGFLVEVTAGTTLTIKNDASVPAGKSNNDYIRFTVANSQYEDVAYAWFDKGLGLGKVNHRNNEAPMLYINQNGNNYAIATMDDNTESFNLNFKAMATGKYTLGYDTKGNYSYLHIIDRMTGEDVDMLMEDKYSFIGSPQDNAERFIVKLSYDNGSSTGSETFAYQSGNEIIVNGEGALEVYDVTGRKVMATTINGVETINELNSGVYIFRVIGETLKTQKIVVR